MKIAIVSSFFPSAPAPRTGVPLFAQIPYLRRLAQVQVICPRAKYPPVRFLQPRTHLYRHAAAGYDLPGADAIHVPFHTVPLIGRAVNGYLGGRAVLPALRSFSPDVIVAYTVYPDGYGALWAGEKLGIPVILFAIGSDVRYVGDRVQLALVKSALRRADFVLSVSQELRERTIALGASPDRSSAILNGCDTSTFRPLDRVKARAALRIRPEAEEIVFVGRLVPLKGLRELFEAVALVRQERPRIELTCIGEGPLENELRARAARSDLSGALRFVSAATPDEISQWMAASDITCLPSYSEGCPNVVIESLACGRAVVASNVGGVPELVNSSNGVMVEPRNEQALARGIREALGRQWDEKAIAAAAGRSWMDVARETIEACERIVDERAGHPVKTGNR